MLQRSLLFVLICLTAAMSQSGCVEEENPIGVLALLSGTREITAQVDGNVVTGTLQPLWGDHYDLSYTFLDYPSEAGFTALASSLEPRSWRCSVGRWENGPFYPANATSSDVDLLKALDREYYRGPNDIGEADNPANYDFTYLDTLLTALNDLDPGVEPYLCFDYMPFTLASEQDPANENNIALTDAGLSFSNGIRTSPPLNNAVYARVVRNVIRHTKNLFKVTTGKDYGITYYEIGNEPDLVYADQTPAKLFWTGTRAQFIAMYNAIAAEVVADAGLNSIKLGGGSFGLLAHEDIPYFADDFLADVEANGTRLDFFSYHSYGDKVEEHYLSMLKAQQMLDDHSLTPEVVNAEWGRALDGLDSVYDTIEHGIFRAKVMALMEVFQIRIAHESILRDIVGGSGINGVLGLIKTNPAGPKPASDVYLALNMMNSSLQALNITITNGGYMLAGKSSDDSRMVIIFIGDEPGLLGKVRINLEVSSTTNWHNQAFTVKRYLVSQDTWSAGEGVKLIDTTPGNSATNPIYTDSITYGPGLKQGRVLVWEMTRP